MPELPEVQTTASQLNKVLPGLSITDVWTDWEKMLRGEPFSKFKKEIRRKKVVRAYRRAKNVLIELSGGKTLLVHMKMTGHLLYGKYKFTKRKWVPDEKGPLEDPFNRFVHFLFTLSNGKHLAFSDTRKFGKIALLDTATMDTSPHLALLGPEPLEKNFTLPKFKERIKTKQNGRIKQVLMDQSVIAGIGNIYSDEMLMTAGIHPEERVKELTDKDFKTLFGAMKRVLAQGIDFGGDSTSDYRNIYGVRGKFHERHRAYRRTGERCVRNGCAGVILRKIVGGRSAHFCDTHQPRKK